ncbi:MAG: stalk domain-containing protein [Firmicutes bacterium]|nr:stalk domain-containing protein [Bacillota bacterium]
MLFVVGAAVGAAIGLFVTSQTLTPPLQGAATPSAAGKQIRLNGIYTGIIIEEGNVVPLQPLVDALGGTTAWNDGTRQITIAYGRSRIVLRPNIRAATVNRRQTYLSSPLRIVEGRSMVTLDFITRYMGLGIGIIDNTVIATTETTDRLPVLVYHHILPREKAYAMQDNPWLVTTETFEEQIRYLHQNGFYPVTLCDLEHFLFHGRNLPARSIMIHFDDGYYSNFVYAAPIMRRYGMRGQIFLITGEVEALGEVQPPLDYECLTFAAFHTIVKNTDVFETASHSHNLHEIVYGTTDTRLTRAMRENIIADTIQSFKFVENHRAYAFPLSQYNEYVINALQDVGIIMAFGGENRHITRNSNPFTLPRFTVYNAATMRRFRNVVN